MKRTEIQNLASSIEDELIRMFDYDTRRSVVRLNPVIIRLRFFMTAYPEIWM